MGIKTRVIYAVAKRTQRRIESGSRHVVKHQQEIWNDLIHKGSTTFFGKEHGFLSIQNHKDFTSGIPIRDYEDFMPYIEKILAGHEDVVWHLAGTFNKYFAKNTPWVEITVQENTV